MFSHFKPLSAFLPSFFTEPNLDNLCAMKMIEDLRPESIIRLGQELGLDFSKMKKMPITSIHSDMIHAWLMQYDNVPKQSGNPTWRSLAQALVEMKCWRVVKEISESECWLISHGSYISHLCCQDTQVVLVNLIAHHTMFSLLLQREQRSLSLRI